MCYACDYFSYVTFICIASSITNKTGKKNSKNGVTEEETLKTIQFKTTPPLNTHSEMTIYFNKAENKL